MKNSGCAFVRIWLIVRIYILGEKYPLLGEKSSLAQTMAKKNFVVTVILRQSPSPFRTENHKNRTGVGILRRTCDEPCLTTMERNFFCMAYLCRFQYRITAYDILRMWLQYLSREMGARGIVFGLDWQQRLRFVWFRSCKYTMITPDFPP
jgi:hypothetical protein